MRTVGCIIARTSSKRLPGKVLFRINGKTLIEHLVHKIKNSKHINCLYICTTTLPEDKILTDVAKSLGIRSYRGSVDSIIDRLLDVAKIENADNVVRITGDNIFTEEKFIDTMIEYRNKSVTTDYMRTEYLPLGITAEVISVKALKKCRRLVDPKSTEYLMWQMFNPDVFNCRVLLPPTFVRKEYYNLSIDTEDDIERTKFIINNAGTNGSVSYTDILELDRKRPIPFFEVKPDFEIKTSQFSIIPFREYRSIMVERIKKSKSFREVQKNTSVKKIDIKS